MSDPTDIIQRQLAAYNARDLEAFVATYSPTITLRRGLNEPVSLTGLAELRATYGELFANNPNLHCDILNRMVVGNYVIDHEQITGRGTASPSKVVVIYEVQAGLIERVWVVR